MDKAILIEIAKYIQTAKLDSEGGIIWTVNEKKELQHLADVRGWGHIQNMFKTEQEAMDFQDAIGQFIVDAVNEKITSLTAPVPDGKVKRITLCGSTKFKREFEAINRQLTLEGNVVYSVSFFGHADKVPLTIEQKTVLDEVHKKKIDNSDAIFVIDVDGYIGESTRSEIDHANKTGKVVRYLSDFPDLIMLCDSVTMSLDNLTPKTPDAG